MAHLKKQKKGRLRKGELPVALRGALVPFTQEELAGQRGRLKAVGRQFIQGVKEDPLGTALDFVPIVGDIKSAQEAVTGRVLTTGQKLGTAGRLLAAAGTLPFVPGSIKAVGRGAKRIPKSAVLKVSSFNARPVRRARGSGEAYLDSFGNTILDGQKYAVGDVAYLWNDRFFKTPPSGLLSEVKTLVNQAEGRIAGLKKTMWQIKWKEPKHKFIKKGEKHQDMFGEEVATKDTRTLNWERYQGVDSYHQRYLNEVEELVDTPSEKKLMQALYDKELDDLAFEVGGILHLPEGARQITEVQKKAIRAYQDAGGRLGATTIRSLEDPGLIEGAVTAHPGLSDILTKPIDKLKPIK